MVLSGYRAVPPPGVDSGRYGLACLTDSYEVLAGLHGIRAALAGPAEELAEVRWPEDPVLPADGRALRPVAEWLLRRPADRTDDADGPVAGAPSELIMIPADVPDLPELIIAKVAKGLQRADVALAPEVGGDGLAAFGVRLPWPSWLPDDLDLDLDCLQRLSDLAPRRNLVVRTPGWHRMRRPDSVHRLDPGLEGWDNVRLLLTGW